MSTRTNIGINVLLLFFLSLGFPVRCFCEDLSLQKDRVLTEKEKKDARELISVIKARIEAAVNDSQIKRNKIPKNIPQNVVAHFKENPRVFLPSKEEVESQMKKQFEKVSLERLDVRAIAEKAIPQKFSAPVGVRIPECTGSRIRRDSFNKT